MLRCAAHEVWVCGVVWWLRVAGLAVAGLVASFVSWCGMCFWEIFLAWQRRDEGRTWSLPSAVEIVEGRRVFKGWKTCSVELHMFMQ